MNEKTIESAPNTTFRNTLALVSMTLLIGMAGAAISSMLHLSRMNSALIAVIVVGLLFAISHFKGKALGILFVVALTFFIGFSFGPMITHLLYYRSHGEGFLIASFGGTAISLLLLAGYMFIKKKSGDLRSCSVFLASLVGGSALIGSIVFNVRTSDLMTSIALILPLALLMMYLAIRATQDEEKGLLIATVDTYAPFDLMSLVKSK